MNREPVFVLPRNAAEHIAGSTDASQRLTLNHLPSEEIYIVNGFYSSSGNRMPTAIPREYKTLHWSGTRHEGRWVKGLDPTINIRHLELLRRPDTCIPLEAFQALVPGVQPALGELQFVITFEPDLPEEVIAAGGQQFAGWIIDRDAAWPALVDVEPELLGLAQFETTWPVAELANDVAMVVGVGSIGGAVADSLAAMGVGHSVLVDPDRFSWHNVVRHVLGKEAVGRLKVDAMRDHLKERWPEHTTVALPINVASAADLIRPMLRGVDLVVCAADGIAPRRVVSHLARRAGIPAVLACVLDDGGIGEILRLRPTPGFGCLLCHRAHIAAAGGIDPEADQELAYGTGRTHKPMTAIPTDLHAVGQLTAKVAVATLLESKHGVAMRIPGEHAVLGLRSDLDLAPPYDVSRVGQIKWDDMPAPRPTCPTCSTP